MTIIIFTIYILFGFFVAIAYLKHIEGNTLDKITTSFFLVFAWLPTFLIALVIQALKKLN